MKRFVMFTVLALVATCGAVGYGWAQGHCAPIPGDRPPFIDCPEPQLVNGVVMVPMRAMFQFLVCSVQYWPSNGAIEARDYSGKVIDLWLGNTQARVAGRIMSMEVPPRQIDGTTYVPLRFVSTSLGAGVTWSDAIKTATVCYCRRRGAMTLGRRGITAMYCD